MKTFPKPKFLVPVHPVTGEELKEGTESDFIQNNFAELSGEDRAKALGKIMGPSRPGYKVREHVFYLLGPFQNSTELLECLEGNRMLKLVHGKWKDFEPDVLDIAFSGCKAVYLQIRWEGWFVRPVRELTQEQLTVLVGLARGVLETARQSGEIARALPTFCDIEHADEFAPLS